MTDAMNTALRLLVDEKNRLDSAITILQAEQAATPRRGRPPGSKTVKKRGRPKMSAEHRAAVSQRMKKYWAAKRRQKAASGRT